MQTQGIADVVKSDAVGQLCVKQADDVAPRGKGSGLFIHLGFTRYLANQELGNEVANLPQQVQLKRLERSCFYFSSLPCGKAKQIVPAFS
jgi:hypothetical protein